MLKNTMKKIIFIMIIIMFNSFQISNVNATDAKNNNPMLKAIKINGIDIEPTFDMLTTEYVVNVDNSVEKVVIEAIPDDSKAKVNVVGDKNLKEGRNVFEINVVAENGKDKQSYYIYITKGEKEKSNANLKSLKVGEYELAPKFDADTINYAFEYPKNIEYLNIEAIPENEKSKIEVIGNENLKDVIQNIQVKVTAEDSQTVKTYYLTAKKEGIEVENPEGKEPIIENKKNKEVEDTGIFFYIIIVIMVTIIISIAIKLVIERRKNEKKYKKNKKSC